MDFVLHSKYQPCGDQPTAIKQLVDGLNDGLRTQVLRGVTGSGKTEVYLTIIERLVAEGKSCIMLVPEISLTPQMIRILHP